MKTPRLYQRDVMKRAWRLSKRFTGKRWWIQQRLGKCLMALYTAEGEEKRYPTGIFAPTSAVGSWLEELCDMGFTVEDGDVLDLSWGSRNARSVKLSQFDGQWIVANPEIWRALPDLNKQKFGHVICDETASWLLNPSSKITKWFLRGFNRVDERWALAGVPDPDGSLLSYWTQTAWTTGGAAFGHDSYWGFRNSRFYESGYSWLPKRGTEKELREMIGRSSIVLRRTDVDMEVNKVWQTRKCGPLPKALRETYRGLMKWYKAEYEGEEVKRTGYDIVRLHWLRFVSAGWLPSHDEACMPDLTHTFKLKVLKDLLTGELSDEKVVIWCRYNHEIFDIMKYLDLGQFRGLEDKNANCITGEIRPYDRQAIVNAAPRWLFCQPQAMETGMNLGAYDTAIYFTPPNGPLQFSQTQDRILGDLEKDGVLFIVLETENRGEEGTWLALRECEENRGKFNDALFKYMSSLPEKGHW